MTKINWGRVFLGGLLAGVIINVFEIVALGHRLASAAVWIFALEAVAMASPRFGSTPLYVHASVPLPRLRPYPASATRSSGWLSWQWDVLVRALSGLRGG